MNELDKKGLNFWIDIDYNYALKVLSKIYPDQEEFEKETTNIFTGKRKMTKKEQQLYLNELLRNSEHISRKDNNFEFIKYMIPSKKREEIIGDLIELENNMIEEDMKAWKIKTIIAFQIVIIIISLFRIKFSDLTHSEKNERV